MKYDLEHLTQDASQEVLGPIQDDEALLLFAVIRTMRIHNILEIGGLSGYSARNFSKATIDGLIYTVDINPVPKIANNHIVITKDCNLITKEDIPTKIDMVFFDAHVLEPQLNLYKTLLNNEIIDDEVVLVFHDTNLHPNRICGGSYPIDGGWVHQKVERDLVEYFKSVGFDAISFHTKLTEDTIKFRHGVTIMKKHKKLTT